MPSVDWSLPILVFFARILDVTLGTMRIIFLGKGKRLLPPFLGFVEVFIWIVVVSHLVNSVSNLAGYLAYAAGFATGTYVGSLIERQLAIGTLIVRAIVSDKPEILIRSLAEAGFGITYFEAHGANGPVQVIYSVINRKELDDVVRTLHDTHPHVFYTVEEARLAAEGVFHHSAPRHLSQYIGLKGKR
jgi:uncharacterized protein YebE (UPF0316 family)